MANLNWPPPAPPASTPPATRAKKWLTECVWARLWMLCFSVSECVRVGGREVCHISSSTQRLFCIANMLMALAYPTVYRAYANNCAI